jgi:NADH-quinone oxidoreductase subunit A
MLAEYFGLLLIFSMGLALVGALLVVNRFTGATQVRGESRALSSADALQRIAAHRHHAFRFYTIAIVFVVFTAETTFFYAWGAVFGVLGLYGVVAMAVFTLPFAVGLYYGWMKGGLEW